ncbi:MAG TPA: hypothetical protein DDW56_27160 [Cyanobacteria bacterium UBA11366]|nr:hypothetical protein [Cyanobacteria bacterium UBA11366]HBS69848.1 hypothetical protein [Cyanobacteria bacterium UBA11153]
MIAQAMLNERDRNDLASSGLEEVMEKLGHFSASIQEAYKAVGYSLEGLIFNYINPLTGQSYKSQNGSPFHRIKPKWELTDEFEEPPKYLSPKESGCRPYFSPILQHAKQLFAKAKIPILITEGEKKTDKITLEAQKNGFPLLPIGIAGVSAWVDKTPRSEEDKLEESRPIPELFDRNINWERRVVFIGYDSDACGKKEVRYEMLKLAKFLEETYHSDTYLIRLPSEMDGSKNGVDDFLTRYGWEAFLGLINISEKALKQQDGLKKKSDKVLHFPQTPSIFIQAVMIYSVFQKEWKYRENIGWYKYSGKIWRPIIGQDELESEITSFREAQQWKELNHMDSLVRYLKGKLLCKEGWSPQHLLIFANGTLDVQSGRFFKDTWDANHCSTEYIDFDYDVHAECPVFLDFLSASLNGDKDAIELIRAFMKWMLSPKLESNHPVQKSLDLLGEPGTGKGTLLEVFSWIAGQSSSSFTSDSLSSPTELVNYLDKKVIIDSDALSDLGKSSSSILSKIICNEPVTVRNYYKKSCTARLKTTVIRSMNTVSQVSDGLKGLSRKIITMRFNHQPKEIDPFLGEKLRTELSGIFQWAWRLGFDSCLKILNSAGKVAAVQEASLEVLEVNNDVYSFLSETYPLGSKDLIPASDLYRQYGEWCKQSGVTSQKKMKTFIGEIRKFKAERHVKHGGYSYYKLPNLSVFDAMKFMGMSRDIVARPDPLGSENAIAQTLNLDYSKALKSLFQLGDQVYRSDKKHTGIVVDVNTRTIKVLWDWGFEGNHTKDELRLLMIQISGNLLESYPHLTSNDKRAKLNEVKRIKSELFSSTSKKQLTAIKKQWGNRFKWVWRFWLNDAEREVISAVANQLSLDME